MNIPHEKFCVLPWISLEASPVGTARPCCIALDELCDDTGEKHRLGRVTLEQLQNSQQMVKLRQQFLRGEQPQTCRRCWQEERADRKSKRMHTLDRLQPWIKDLEWNEQAKPLMFLDLKLGNICNLKCRICGSWSSSAFATEELAFTQPHERKSSFHYTMTQEGAWPRQSPFFWQDLKAHMGGVRYIEFTGGEPFMIREHFDLLQDLVDDGHAANIEIHYNTNGTQWPDRAADLWSRFRHVEIAFSIDDVGPRFEYQRTNAEWHGVCANLQKFQDLRLESTNISLQVCCTVNVFNIFYLDEVARWIDQQPWDFVYWNMLHEAYYFGIASLPAAAKEVITKKLQAADVPNRFREEFDRVIDFMNRGASLDGDILRMRIKDLDFKRQQSLNDIMPEFAQIINYDYHPY